jgi:hypothetical protein
MRLVKGMSLGLLSAALLAGVEPAQARNEFQKTWTDLYGTARADCATCHGSNTGTLNAYGKDLCLQLGGTVPKDITPQLRAIESLDSDRDPAASGNLAEINAPAQPGWTAGSNPLYSAKNCAATGNSVPPPSSVPLPYDPVVGGAPVAVPGGPYAAVVGENITFDGNASTDSDGTIVSYLWSFGDGMTGTGATVQHAYTVAGTYSVTLTVTDNDGKSSTAQTTAKVTSLQVLDLDIGDLSVTKLAQVGRPVSIQVSVINNGAVLGQALATVVGTQNGAEVYRWRLNVYDNFGGSSTKFNFPAYTPAAAGNLEWTATIADGDADTDSASAVTEVK